jgi:hypothetical protein
MIDSEFFYRHSERSVVDSDRDCRWVEIDDFMIKKLADFVVDRMDQNGQIVTGERKDDSAMFRCRSRSFRVLYRNHFRL